MAKVRLTSGGFNDKHPRGARGRFTSKPEPAKPAKVARRKRDNNVKDTLRTEQLQVKRDVRISQERLKVLADIPREKRRRLLAAAKVIKSIQATAPVDQVVAGAKKGKVKVSPEEKRLLELNKRIDKATKAAEKDYKGRIKELKKDSEAKKLARRIQRAKEKGKPVPYSPWTDKEIKTILGQDKKNTVPGASVDPRPALDRSRLAVRDGKLDVWRDTPHAKYKGDFKVSKDANFKYTVFHEGKPLELNHQSMVMKFNGETIKGVPSLNARLRELDDGRLVSDMASNMRMVEAWDTKSIRVPAPRWDVVHMGGKVDPELVAKKLARDANGGYGGMELHHINQWAKYPFDQLTRDVNDGKVTLDEAKVIMRDQLRPNPNIKSGYEIAVLPKGQREYVVLPAGTHNTNSPLYRANHPLGIHPDTGEPAEFGIPADKKGSKFGSIEGREYHETIRDGFWAEYRRREVHVIQNELNRRVKEGTLTHDRIAELWNGTIDRQEQAIKDSKRGTKLS